MDTDRRQYIDSSGNQKGPNINVNKDNLALGLPTLNKIPKPTSRASPLLFIKLSSTLVKKKPHYKMVFAKKAELKKKINSNIKKQNVIIGKRIKK